MSQYQWHQNEILLLTWTAAIELDCERHWHSANTCHCTTRPTTLYLSLTNDFECNETWLSFSTCRLPKKIWDLIWYLWQKIWDLRKMAIRDVAKWTEINFLTDIWVRYVVWDLPVTVIIKCLYNSTRTSRHLSTHLQTADAVWSSRAQRRSASRCFDC